VKQIRKRLTYANVMSTIAVFFVVGGASALAATELAKNSVGTKQLKGNAVTTGKIKKEAVAAAKIKTGAVGTSKLGPGSVTSEKLGAGSVTGEKLGAAAVDASKLGKAAVTNEKLADNSVTGAKVADGSLTGADINQGSLTQVKAANVYGVTFQEVGGPKIINASDPGIKSGGCFLVCAIEFPRDVATECSYTTSPIDQGSGSGEAAMSEAFPGGDDNTVLVVMWNDEGNLIAHDFAMTVVCPTTS
jgi:hypothetical protein